MPRVLPQSSVLPARGVPQSPARVALSTANVRFTQVSISISACSATACELEPGAWTTATPRRVAAGMSTVSSPTPCRPTTLSDRQAAIRLSVHRGRTRKRIPCASAAILTRPASVSSSQTTTRASLSRNALPSGWIGPASTISGRGSVAIDADLLSSSPRLGRRGRPRILLLPRHQDEARSVQRERRAVEPAVELDAAPALGAQHRGQLVRRVKADLALADQLLRALLRLGRRAPQPEPAGAPATRRRVERVLDAERPAVHPLALLGRQRPHELVAV